MSSSTFGQLFALPVDGQIYAQPLYLSALAIPRAGTHNVVFVATEHDSVYAFDADSNVGVNASPLWRASLVSTAHGAASGATPVSSQVAGDDITPEYGITGTPVIDPAAGILYVVSFTQEGTSVVLRLHVLSVTTGAEMLGGPVALQAQVSGVGNGSSGGVLKFDPLWESQRPGLMLLNGIVYIGFAAHEDQGPWHGWILSYNASTLKQVAAFCTSANGTGAGIWMGGDGLAADVVDPTGHPFGRMLVPTGNGDYTATTPYSNSMDYGDSILSLDLTNGKPVVQDEFTPFNQAAMNSSDDDLGSGGVVILPDQTVSPKHLLAQEGKSGTLYLVNRDQMGGYNSTDKVVQEVASTPDQTGIWGGPAYWNGSVYVGESSKAIKAYSLSSGVLSAKPTSTSPKSYGGPGPALAISSTGNTNGILWALEADGYHTGGSSILRAFDATNLSKELYNSTQVPSRDSAGTAIKFVVPTIANGKVYVGTAGQLNVYGLLSSEPTTATPSITPGSTSFDKSIQVTISDTTSGSTIYYTADGSAPSTASIPYTGPITVNYTQTIKAIAVAPGQVWSAPAMATYASQGSTATPVVTPAGGTYYSLPVVTITDASPGAVIYFTTDGSVPSPASTVYAGPVTLTGSETLRAIAFAPGLSGSTLVSQSYITQSGVNYGNGFSQATSQMTFNGAAGLNGSQLELTNGYSYGTGTAFVTLPLNIQAFKTDFVFQLSNAVADGITFTIQGVGPTSKGGSSGGLGYASILKSLAIKFDINNDAGEGKDSTGVYINGASPTIPAIDLSTSGINLSSSNTMAVHLVYDGTNLSVTITDQVTGASWSGAWQVNIPQLVGGNNAYIGFTASTQLTTAVQKILTWTYIATAPGQHASTATPSLSPQSGTYAGAQLTSITETTPGAVTYYTVDGTPPTTLSNVYSRPFTVSASEKIQSMAVVAGGAVSGLAAATLAISQGPRPPCLIIPPRKG